MLATGPAGPLPYPDYCAPQCYTKGKRELSKFCTCKGCNGDAHGRGQHYAFNHGYLKFSPSGSRKPRPGQEMLFPKETLDEELITDQPETEST